MSQASETPTSSDTEGARPWDLRLAHLVSDVISPPIVIAVVLIILGILAGTPSTWGFIAFYIGFTIFLPFLFVLWQLRTGRISSIHIPIRQQRYPLMVLTVVLTILSWLVLWRGGASYTLTLFAGVGIFQAALIALITFFWKISAHTTSIAGLAVFIVYLFGWAGAPALALIPLVAWARIRTHSHTLSQTLGGILAGAGFIIGVLLIIHLQCAGLNFTCG
jgi:membrane-associated phospholipid phosphatase